MIGDTLDIRAILRSAASICSAVDNPEECGSKYLLSKKDRQHLSNLANLCARNFSTTEHQHRAHFGLTDRHPAPVSVSPIIRVVWFGTDQAFSWLSLGITLWCWLGSSSPLLCTLVLSTPT